MLIPPHYRTPAMVRAVELVHSSKKQGVPDKPPKLSSRQAIAQTMQSLPPYSIGRYPATLYDAQRQVNSSENSDDSGSSTSDDDEESLESIRSRSARANMNSVEDELRDYVNWKSGKVPTAVYHASANAMHHAAATRDADSLLEQYSTILIQQFGEYGTQELSLATAGTLMWDSPISMLIFDIAGAPHVCPGASYNGLKANQFCTVLAFKLINSPVEGISSLANPVSRLIPSQLFSLPSACLINVDWRQSWSLLSTTASQTIGLACSKHHVAPERQSKLYSILDGFFNFLQKLRDQHVFHNGQLTKHAVVSHAVQVIFVITTCFRIARALGTTAAIDPVVGDPLKAGELFYQVLNQELSIVNLELRWKNEYSHTSLDSYHYDPFNLRSALAFLLCCCPSCGKYGTINYCVDPRCSAKNSSKAAAIDKSTWLAVSKKRTEEGYAAYLASFAVGKSETYFARNQDEITFTRPSSRTETGRV